MYLVQQKKLSLLILPLFTIILYFSSAAFAANNAIFLDSAEEITSLFILPNDSIIAAAKTHDHGVALIKLDKNRKSVWNKKFGGDAHTTRFPLIYCDTIHAATLSPQKSITALFHTVIYDKKRVEGVRFLQLDSQTGKILQKTFIKDDNASLYPVAIVPRQNHFLIALIAIDSQLRLVSQIRAYDADFKLLWKSIVPNPHKSDLALHKLYPTKNGFIAIGTLYDYKHPYKTVALTFYSKKELHINKTHTLPCTLEANTFIRTQRGFACIYEKGNFPVLVQFDSRLHLISQKRLNDINGTVTALTATKDNGFVLAGRYYICKNSCNFFIKLDSHGNLMRLERFGGKFWDTVHVVTETDDSYIVAGSNLSHFTTKRVGWIRFIKK